MSKMWQDSYNLVDEQDHITGVGEITETGFGCFQGILQQTKGKVVIHVMRNWHMILYLDNDDLR